MNLFGANVRGRQNKMEQTGMNTGNEKVISYQSSLCVVVDPVRRDLDMLRFRFSFYCSSTENLLQRFCV